MTFSKARRSGEDFLKYLAKRYRITKLDNQSYKLVSKRTNTTWKIEILRGENLNSGLSSN